MISLKYRKMHNKREQPVSCSLLPSALKASKRTNPIQIDAEVRPEEPEPSEPCNRSAPDEYREEPELLTIVQPYVCVAEQATSDRSRVNGKRGSLHLRYKWRRGSCRHLSSSRCPPRKSWCPRKSSWNPRSARHTGPAWRSRKSSPGPRRWKKPHI